MAKISAFLQNYGTAICSQRSVPQQSHSITMAANAAVVYMDHLTDGDGTRLRLLIVLCHSEDNPKSNMLF